MLRTLLCDDEGPARGLLSDILRDIAGVELVSACSSAPEALEIINRGGIDLAFFDVEMPALSGVEAARNFTIDPRPLVVFTTAYPDYAIDAFGIDAIDYILKPLDHERVCRAVQKAERLHRLIGETRDALAKPMRRSDTPATDDVLRVLDAGRLFVIPYREVVWIEAAGDYSLIHRLDGEIAIRRTLSSLVRELPKGRFRRIHRSAIISLAQIREIRRLAKGEAEITLIGGVVLRASRTYRDVIDMLLSSGSFQRD